MPLDNRQIKMTLTLDPDLEMFSYECEPGLTKAAQIAFMAQALASMLRDTEQSIAYSHHIMPQNLENMALGLMQREANNG